MSFFCDAHMITLRSVFKDELEKYASGDGDTLGMKVCEPPRTGVPGTGPRSRRGAAGWRAELHLPFPVTHVTA